MADSKERVTAIVATLDGRKEDAKSSAARLFPLVYGELRALAQSFMARERRDHTLQPTALVHEAYLKLVDQSRVSWRGRTHFFAVGAQAMRRLLVDHARSHKREKRGAAWQRVTLSEVVASVTDRNPDLDQFLSLNAALDRLAQLDACQARIVELRFFGGLTVAEVAEVLGVSKRTVEGDWAHARAWLKLELSGAGEQ